MDSLETQLVKAICEGNIDKVQSLIEKGCKVDVGDIDNLTPLHLAANKGHLEIAKLLISRGANVNCKTTDKMAPLHYAASRGFTDMVALLVDSGAAVDCLDSSDRTPLMLAVIRCQLEVVELLIACGAKVNIEEIHGYTPLCEAVWGKSVEIASLLLRSGAKLTQSQYLLHYAVLHQHLSMTETLLKHGAYPNLRDDHGDTPLILAVSSCNIEMIKLLLHYEASPNYCNSISGTTALHSALHLGYHANHSSRFDEVLRLLCMYNMDLDVVGGLTTPLTMALILGKASYAASLVRAGADVNKGSDQRYQWQTPHPSNLDLALSLGLNSLVYLLVAAGFNLSKHPLPLPTDFSVANLDSIHGWLKHMKANPRRLTDLCRLSIRSQLGHKVMFLVPNLEIPQSLKQFLLFQEIQVEDSTCPNGCSSLRQILTRPLL